MKKCIAIAARLLISALLLWLLFREPSLREKILPHLASLLKEWHWTLAGLACAGLSLLFGAWRWWVILRVQVPAVSYASTVRINLIASFFNITSLGTLGGDAYRIIAINQRHPGTATAAGISVMVDHLVGMLATALLFFAFGFAAMHEWPELAPGVQSILQHFGIILSLVSAGLLLSVLTLSPSFIDWASKFLPRIANSAFVRRASRKFAPVWESRRAGLAAVGISTCMLLCYFTTFYCGVRAVGASAPWLPVLMAMPIVDVAAALPISVSGLGVREKTFETLLAALIGLPQATGVAASLAGWLFNVCWGLVGGLLFISQPRNK